jgi:hypothetical protein
MKFIYKNWFIHNVFAHPLSEILFVMVACIHPSAAAVAAAWIHDVTLPAGAIKYEAARKGSVSSTTMPEDYGWY